MKRLAPRGKVIVSSLIGILIACTALGCDPGQGLDDSDDDDEGGGGDESGACSAPAGDYSATYIPVSDDCGGVDALPSDRFSVSTDGEILDSSDRPVGDGSAPSGCVDDDVTMRGCVVSFTRECQSELLLLGVADVQGDYRLDFGNGSGSVDIRIAVYDGVTLLQSCQAQQDVRITSR
jgi:hypothetical protein